MFFKFAEPTILRSLRRIKMVFYLRNQALILLVDFWNDTGRLLVEMALKN